MVSIEQAILPGEERFPARIEVHFNYYGEDVKLYLQRDDELTDLLSEGVFMSSKFLPSNVYDDEQSEVWFSLSTRASPTLKLVIQTTMWTVW